LMEQFRLRKVEKFYHALTDNRPVKPHATLINYLHKDLKNKKALVLDEPAEGYDKVMLKYRTQRADAGKCHWDIELLTGKYHQIRAQLAHAGCPIIGDVLYGATPNEENKIELQAYRLVFPHPISGEMMDVRI